VGQIRSTGRARYSSGTLSFKVWREVHLKPSRPSSKRAVDIDPDGGGDKNYASPLFLFPSLTLGHQALQCCRGCYQARLSGFFPAQLVHRLPQIGEFLILLIVFVYRSPASAARPNAGEFHGNGGTTTSSGKTIFFPSGRRA